MQILTLSQIRNPSSTKTISCLSSSREEKMNVISGGEVSLNCPAAMQKQKQQAVKLFVKRLAPPVMVALVALSSPVIVNPPQSFAQMIDVHRGATLFQRACIGCHDAGGNIIQPGATLFLKDLQRNGVETADKIYQITYYGKGRMPGFGENCTPRGQCTFGPRLQEDEIKLLAEFVKSQADQGWRNIEADGN